MPTKSMRQPGPAQPAPRKRARTSAPLQKVIRIFGAETQLVAGKAAWRDVEQRWRQRDRFALPASRTVREPVLISIGVDWDGRCKILAVEMADRKSRSSWKDCAPLSKNQFDKPKIMRVSGYGNRLH
jgi:hypothetical protein